MSNYQNAKIYKVINTENDKIYVGSTVSKYLSSRLAKYKFEVTRNHSYFHIEMVKTGSDKFSIVLLENYPCNDINELLAREQHWIDQLNPEYNRNRFQGKDPAKRQAQARRHYLKNVKPKRFKCDCGSEFVQSELKRHNQTQKHQSWEQSKQIKIK